ncbi:MAG TPA: matrixin family metalloprotease, partial [Planctomycetaceae bacterium]|nr:matrixin family metalloprotease [Planctomycetaceae bacterium]
MLLSVSNSLEAPLAGELEELAPPPAGDSSDPSAGAFTCSCGGHGYDVAHSLWYIPPDFGGTFDLHGDGHTHDDDDGGCGCQSGCGGGCGCLCHGLADGASTDLQFSVSGWKWSQPGGLGSDVTITYSFSNLLDGGLGGGLSAGQLQAAVEEALALWAAVAPLNFVEVVDSGPLPTSSDTSYFADSHPDIRFGHHYIDGGSGANVLAHAYFPYGSGLSGDVHYDNSNTWTLNPATGIDFLEVTVHELGHALGLNHEPMPSSGGLTAILNPYYGGRYNGLGTAFLFQDDINGIQAIYGAGTGSVAPLGSSGGGDGGGGGSAPADDHGNSAAAATHVSIGSSTAGAIEAGGDLDWFAVDLSAGASYVFATSLGTLHDSTLTLVATNGTTQLAFDDDGGPGLASQIEFTATVSGTHYLRVAAYGSSQTGTYTLSVTQTSADLARPTLISPLSSTGDATPTFQWNAVSGAAQYEIQIDDLTTGQNAVVSSSGLTGTNFTPGDPLAKLHQYRWQVRAVTGDGQPGPWSSAASFSLTNQAPTLSGLADQTISYLESSLTVVLPATDADGDGLTYTAEFLTADPLAVLAWELDQQLGLQYAGSYSTNWGGAGEKWMQSASGTWYFITPSGAFHRWTGARPGATFLSSSPLVATFDSSYHASPAKLHNAALPAGSTDLGGSSLAVVNSHELVIMPGDGYTGNLRVRVTASDGLASAQASFTVSIVNHAPELNLTNHAIPHSQPSLTVDLPATDADGDVVSYTATLRVGDPLEELAWQLDQQLGLRYTGSYSTNWGGAGEKWMQSASGTWYFITPSGTFHRWTGAPAGATFVSSSPLVATLDSRFHADPSRLHNAPTPTAGDVGGSTAQLLNGRQLVVTPGEGFLGNLVINVTASDGVNQVSGTRTVSVVNTPPQLDLPNRDLAAGAGPLVIDLPATDADGDAVTYTAGFVTGDPLLALAYQLDQQLGLYSTGSYSVNWGGAGEKWMQSASGTWYFITPAGSFHRWTGAKPGSTFLSSSPLVATLDARFHSNPARLHDAPPSTGSDPGTSTVSIEDGNRLTVTPGSGFTGELHVTVTASDGAAEVSATFVVTVRSAAEMAEVAFATGPATAGAAFEPHVLYVNFDGAVLAADDLVRWAGDDWADHLAAVVDPEGDGVVVEAMWSDWDKRDVFIADVLARLDEQFAPYGLTASRHVGGAVEGIGATTVFVGAVGIHGAGSEWAGLASDVDHGNDNATDVAFVLPLWMNRSFTDSVVALANLILHEAGHTWGLDEADPASTGNLMASGNIERLLDAHATFTQWPVGTGAGHNAA